MLTVDDNEFTFAGPYGTREAAEGKGKVFDGAGWRTTVMKLGKPGDIDQE